MKISFIGLYEETNLGDPIIARCTEWLFFNHFDQKTASINRVSLDYCERQKKEKLYVFLRWITKLLRLRSIRRKIYCMQMWKLDVKYFKSQLRKSDFIVLVGGGLIKYKYQSFWLHLSAILHVAKKLNIPVYFNALGVEGYSETNYRCQFLKKNLHNDMLERITIRDDYELFIKKYMDGNPKILCKEVADPAVWTKEAYREILKENENRDFIGLGIARGEIFKDNGLSFSRKEAKDLYVSIARTLIQKGCKIRLYTNGLTTDNLFADEIYEELKSENGSVLSLEKPKTTEELVTIINSCKAIVAARLHSCIIAYTLNIPAIGIVWNDKFLMWGKKIGALDNFLTQKEWATETIYSRLKQAVETSYDENIRKSLKDSIFLDIKEIAESIEK